MQLLFFEEDSSLRRRRAGLVFAESYRELSLAWPRKLISTAPIELEERTMISAKCIRTHGGAYDR